MSLRGSVLTCLISRLLSSMVVSTSKFTRIFWKMNAPTLLLGHLEGYWLWQETRIFLWRMWGISFLTNVTRCLNHLVCFSSPEALYCSKFFNVSFTYVIPSGFYFTYLLQTCVEMSRRFSRWPLMTSKLWCFLPHSAKKYARFARNLCKM